MHALLDAGANPGHARATDGITPLYAASWVGHLEVIRELLLRNADPNQAAHSTTSGGGTPLHMAAHNGHLDVVTLLLANRADPRIAATHDGTTPLHMAAQEGHFEVAFALLCATQEEHENEHLQGQQQQQDQEQGQDQQQGQHQPLHQKGQYNDQRRSCNGQQEEAAAEKTRLAMTFPFAADGGTALHMAAQSGFATMVQLLREHGADPTQVRSSDGITPLIMAATSGHIDAVCALLAPPTSIHGSTRSNHRSRRGGGKCSLAADPNQARARKGGTPLIMASFHGHFDVAFELLVHGADPNLATTTSGVSPLFIAARNGHLEVAKLLAIFGADLNKRTTTNGVTPHASAVVRGHMRVAEWFQRVTGWSPLRIAAKYHMPRAATIALQLGRIQPATDCAEATAVLVAAATSEEVYAAWQFSGYSAGTGGCGSGSGTRISSIDGGTGGGGNTSQGSRPRREDKVGDPLHNLMRTFTLASNVVVGGGGDGGGGGGGGGGGDGNDNAAWVQTRQLVAATAVKGWAPSRHHLYHRGVQIPVRTTLLAASRLLVEAGKEQRRSFVADAETATSAVSVVEREPADEEDVPLPLLPPEIWLFICSFYMRSDWPPPGMVPAVQLSQRAHTRTRASTHARV